MINPLINPSYLVPPIIASVASFVLAAVVWYGSRQRSFSNRLFTGILLTIGVWGLVLFAMRASPDVQRAVLWDRALPVATLATFVLFYHFTLAYTNTRGKRGILLTFYLILATAAAISPTELLVERMRLESYGYAPVIGPASYPLLMGYVFLMVAGMYNLVRRYKVSRSYEERNRLVYLAIAVLFPLVGIFLDVLSNLPPVFIWTNLAFCAICTIAILRYQLLDIRVIARKGLAYVLLSVIIAAPYVIALFVLNRVFYARIEQWWQYVLIILPLAIALRPLYSRAQQWVDKAFYRDRYDYLKELEKFSKEAHNITDFKELGITIVRLAGGALRARNVCLLLTSEEGSGLAVVSTLGLDNPPSGTILRNKSILIKWFRSHGETISSNEFDIIPKLQSIARTEKQNLARLMPELYVPIRTSRGELPGLLILGKKFSQQPYSLEDRRLISTASHQIAVTLENAWLYRDAVRAREDLEAWLNSMDDGVIISDRDRKIEFVNKAAAQGFGISTRDRYPAIIEKEAPSDLITQQDKPIDKCVSHYAINFGDREFDVVAAPLSNADGGLSTIEVFRDITERKRAEIEKKELEQKVQLSDRLASIGEMASGIAHEINNPLTGVIGFSQLLMEKDVPEDIRKDLEIIHDGSQRVAGIVKGLLTFARQHKSERTYSDINQLVDSTVALRAYALETSNIRVAVVLDPDLPWTMADAGQLQQVFLNIIINAETEMRKVRGKGNLIIKTERIADTIRISFTDDGPGIAREHLKRIFDPFFTTKQAGEGTGLGLSLCHGIIIEHNGQIYAESEPGKGATFIIELPTVSEEEGEEMNGPAADEPVKIAGARILVVDDEPDILKFLSHLLATEGHQVETADNSSDALEMIKSRRYSLILLDIKLPDMSGIELYQHIKKIAPSLTRRVVFITGDVTGSDTRKFLTENKASYITKPFDIKQLKEELNRILNRDGRP